MDLKVITACVLLMIPLSEASCQICGGQYPDLEEALSQARDGAVEWLANQQNFDGSWPNLNTQNAILGLQLANQNWLASQGLGERLLTKSRLENELLIQLLPLSCNSSSCSKSSSSTSDDDEGDRDDEDNDDSEGCNGGSCSDSGSSSSDSGSSSSDSGSSHSDSGSSRSDSGSSRSDRGSSSSDSGSSSSDSGSSSSDVDSVDEVDDDCESTSNPSCCPSTFERGAGILAQYMLSLQSVCCLTDNFYGFDLKCTMTNLLEDCLEDNSLNFFQYSLAILSMCSCDADIFKEALVKLADGPDETDPCFSPFGDDSGHNIDILSMQVMAMVCASDQAIDKNVPNWFSILNTRVKCIIDGQDDDDGSFGSSAITTALAIQALTSATDPTTWSCNEAVTWLLSQQQTGGNFGGVGGTAQIIPFLGCNDFGSLRHVEIECPEYDGPPMTPTIMPGDPPMTPPIMPGDPPVPPPIMPGDPTFTFTIKVNASWVIDFYSVTILMGESLYFGMLRLADTDPNFTFTTSDSSFGQFIVSINGLERDVDASSFWIIYVLKNDSLTFASKGIEGLIPGMETDLDNGGDCFEFGYTNFSK